MTVKRVALLTAGGYAPCLSSAVGGLIERYTELVPDVEIIAYKHGYWGLLSGEKIVVDDEVRAKAGLLHNYGGSPIGNSRVKLTNTADLVKRGLIQEGQNALEVAANKLKADGVDVLHTIGGDDTNTTAADLAKYLHDNGHEMQVVGLPKTIDNDIVPIRQSLGAQSAAEQSSVFAQNIIAEHGSNPKMLIIHEIMGRACGYLTAQAAEYYQTWHSQQEWLPGIGHRAERWDVHAVFLPELALDIDAEAERLKAVMDDAGCVNI
ncbi:MAG: pyrophosphate--fructose-6-phosphate 1-phosphotransferase, partial [Brachybacterium sp.]